MATSSVTGNHDSAADTADDSTRILGPSDSSDSGSDTLGQRADLAQPDDSLGGGALEPLDGGSDTSGTGERANVEGDMAPDGADILPDRIIGPGGGAIDAAQVHLRSGSLAADEDDDSADDEED
ncbi:MAG TPA: hypothetical protein VIP27_04920 [Variovorax sp.]